MDRLPNDIIKEIAEAFEFRRPLDRWTLQQLRLVNRVFHTFATSVLFKGFDTFNLGDSYEDLKGRIATLASSNLRSRIKGLRISLSSVIPRFILTQIRVSESYEEPPYFFMKELEPQLEVLAVTLGENFRFQSVTIDTVVLLTTKTDAHSSYHRMRMREMIFFFNVVHRYLGKKIFERVHHLFLRLCRHDLDYFLFKPEYQSVVSMRDFELENLMSETEIRPIDEELSRFLSHVGKLDVCFPFSDALALKDHRNLGRLLSNTDIEALRLWYSKRTHRRMFHRLFQDTDAAPAPKLQRVALENCKVPYYNAFVDMLCGMENLTALGIRCVELEERGRWTEVITTGIQKLEHLVDIRFEALSYHRQRHAWLHLGEMDIFDPDLKTSYLRPIYTQSELDLESMKDLLEAVEKRRERQGLAMDMWLSVFCRRRDVMFVKTLSGQTEGGGNV